MFLNFVKKIPSQWQKGHRTLERFEIFARDDGRSLTRTELALLKRIIIYDGVWLDSGKVQERVALCSRPVRHDPLSDRRPSDPLDQCATLTGPYDVRVLLVLDDPRRNPIETKDKHETRAVDGRLANL